MMVGFIQASMDHSVAGMQYRRVWHSFAPRGRKRDNAGVSPPRAHPDGDGESVGLRPARDTVARGPALAPAFP